MATGKLVSDAILQLNDWLEAGKFKEGDRLPSERAIAKELGIKYYGLNRAMSRLIAEGRVQREGYRLSMAVAPRASQRLVFHLIVARRTHHLASYRRAAANLDIELIVHDWVAAEEVAAILNQLDSKETAGVVCDPPTESVHAAEWVRAALQLIRHGIPVVCTGGWGVNGEMSAVGANVNHGVTQAFSHLVGLGHRELALVTFPSGNELEMGVDDYWTSLCARNHLGVSGERILRQPSWLTGAEDIDQLVELLAGPWKNVTGLVTLVGYNAEIQSLFTKLARRGRRVPESLSVVAVGNARTLAAAQPRATAAVFDMVLWFELTFDLLRREVREQRQSGAPREPSSFQMLPRLVVRESTRAVEGWSVDKTAGMQEVLPISPPTNTAPLDGMTKRPYPLATKAALSDQPRFVSVDLRPYVNRPLIFRRGWLGDIPLRCLPVGTHEIHGVPFEVLGGPNRADGGAIIFQSTINTTGNARKLPDRLIIPLKGPVEAVYILHGCGYAKPMQPFATYSFHSKKGLVGKVPLVSLGRKNLSTGGIAPTPDGAGLSANIQDWWSDFPHEDFPHACMAPMVEHDEANRVNRHVFLYTLEWINPSPKQPLTHMEIEVDPSVTTTLGMLAVTVVKPRLKT